MASLAALAGVPLAYLIRWTLGLTHSQGDVQLFFAMSLLALLFGFSVFLLEGRQLITPSGVYFLSAGIFVGLAGMLIAWRTPGAVSPLLVHVLAAAHVTNVGTWAVRRFLDGFSRCSRLGRVRQRRWLRDTRRRLLVGGLLVVALAVLVQLSTADMTVWVLVRAAAYLGVAALALAWAITPRRHVMLTSTVAVGVATALYTLFFFSGYGRLVLATLGLACLMLVNMTHPASWQKTVAVAALIPFLIIGGLVRGEDATVADVIQEAQGLGSVYAPMLTFYALVEGDVDRSGPQFERQWGRTFYESAVVWIPRALWQDKPVGFGVRLARFFTPEMAAWGHSLAALAYGEFYVNFWWFGLAMMAVTAGFLLSFLDNYQLRAVSSTSNSESGSLKLITVAVATAGLADYMWAGTFLFISRNGIALMLLGIVGLILSRGRIGTRRTTLDPDYVQKEHVSEGAAE